MEVGIVQLYVWSAPVHPRSMGGHESSSPVDMAVTVCLVSSNLSFVTTNLYSAVWMSLSITWPLITADTPWHEVSPSEMYSTPCMLAEK